MEEGADVKASLVIALQTGNNQSFASLIKSTNIPLYNLKDPNSSNIFHELASSTSNENSIIKLFLTLLSEFRDRYFDEAPEIMKYLLNSQRTSDSQSPLLEAVLYNRKVLFI